MGPSSTTRGLKQVKQRTFDLLRIQRQPSLEDGIQVGQATSLHTPFMPRHATPLTVLLEDGIQILRYQPGQAYIPHHDYFETSARVEDGRYDFDSSGEVRPCPAIHLVSHSDDEH